MAIAFDGITKRISLSSGTTTVSVKAIWSRWVDWCLTSDNSKFLPAFATVGGDDIDEEAGTTIPIFAFLKNGWRVKPQEANHTLAVTDGVLLVEGGGDPFVNTDGTYTVRINYQQPVQAITVATGGGGGITSQDKADIAELAASETVSGMGESLLAQNVGSIKGIVETIVPANLAQVDGDTLAPGRLARSALLIVEGAIDASVFVPTVTQFDSSITETLTDVFNNRIVMFGSGSCRHQVVEVVAYSLIDGRGRFTVTPELLAPVGHGDSFVVL